MSCAGIGTPGRVLGKQGPMDLGAFARVVSVNLVGTFNVVRLAAEAMAQTDPVAGERGVVDTLPDQAEPHGVLGHQLVAEHRKRHRIRPPHQARQQPAAAAVGNQADLRERLDEACRARRDDDVAQKREIGSRACCDAVDRRDHRHRHRADAQRERLVEALDRVPDVDLRRAASACRRDRRVGEVLAGTKAPTGSGDDDTAHGAVVGGGIERDAQLAVHRRSEAVQGLRPVQRQSDDAAGMIDSNERLCQAMSPSTLGR